MYETIVIDPNFFKTIVGTPLTVEALNEAAQLSEVMTVGDDFIPPTTRAEFEQIIPGVDAIEPTNAAETYLFLKAHYQG